MKLQEVKTIDIKTLTWFDRVNGNTYYAQEITVNFAMPNEVTYYNPFQYGYSSFVCFALQRLGKDIEGMPEYPGAVPDSIIIWHNQYKSKKSELIYIEQ